MGWREWTDGGVGGGCTTQREVAGLQAVDSPGVINLDVSGLLSGAQWGHNYHDRLAPLLAAVYVDRGTGGFVRQPTDSCNPLAVGVDEFTSLAELLRASAAGASDAAESAGVSWSDGRVGAVAPGRAPRAPVSYV